MSKAPPRPAGGGPHYGPYGEHDHRFESWPSEIQKAEGGPTAPDCLLWHRPRRRFAFIGADGVNTVMEGSELTLDIVLRWHIRDPEEVDTNMGVDYEEAIYQDDRLVAVITRRDGFPPLVRRLDVPMGPHGGPR